MKEVFEYLGWLRKYETPERAVIIASIIHKLGGNDMVLAINAMEEKGDWADFESFAINEYWSEDIDGGRVFMVWLFSNPANFFELMEKAIKEGVIG